MWRTVKLKDVCTIKTGRKDVNEGNELGLYPFFTCAKEHTFSDGYSFDCEAILIAGNGAVGQTTYYKGKFEAYQRTYVLSDFNDIEPKLLLFILQGRLMGYLSSMVLGNTIPYIKKGMLQDFEFCLPPLAEQGRIVAKLDAVFAEIDKLQQIENQKLQVVTSLYDAKITELLKAIMNENKSVKLKNICERITVGFVGKMSNQYIGSGVPFLRSQSIRPFEISSKGLLYISEEFDETISKSRLKAGDVCVVRTGYPGTAAVVPEEWHGANCSDLVIFTPSSELSSDYLELFFNSEHGKALVMGQVVGAAQKHFNVKSAQEVDFPLTCMKEQQRIVFTAKKMRYHLEMATDAISKKLENYAKLQAAILMQELQSEAA